jgi:hypothetical protein
MFKNRVAAQRVRTDAPCCAQPLPQVERSTKSSRQSPQQVRVILVHAQFRIPQLLNPLARVQHRGVVLPAKRIPDLRKTVASQLLGKRHRHLARTRHGTATPLGQQLHHTNLEITCHGLLDVFDGNKSRLYQQNEFQGLL